MVFEAGGSNGPLVFGQIGEYNCKMKTKIYSITRHWTFTARHIFMIRQGDDGEGGSADRGHEKLPPAKFEDVQNTLIIKERHLLVSKHLQRTFLIAEAGVAALAVVSLSYRE